MWRPTPAYRSPTPRVAGFTLVELALALVMIGILAAIITPRIAMVLQRSSARQAAGVVSTDLEQAVSLAMRLRVPVRIACDCPNGRLLITNRNNGEPLFSRQLGGAAGGFYLQAMSLSPATTDVYPNGVTSGALTVTLTTAVGTRQVVLSSAGFARVLP